jgi:hypothetical protein
MSTPLSKLDNKRFHVAEFGEESVLFDSLSGDTHYLNPIACARLHGLSATEISARWEDMNEQELGDSLKAIDAQFRQWGLID